MLNKIKLFITITICSIISLYFSSCTSTEEMTARISYAQADYPTCERESLKETQTNPQNDEGWGYLALSSFQLKKYEQGKDAYDHYAKLGKNTLDKEFDAIYEDLVDNGVKDFRIGVKQSEPKYKETLSEAKIYFLEASVIKPDNSDVLVNIGLTEEVLGEKDEAMTYYKKALDKNKNDTLAATGLGRLTIGKTTDLISNKKYAECINELQLVVNSILPKSNTIVEDALLDMGVCNFSWGYDLASSGTGNPNDSINAVEKYKSAITYLEPLLSSPNYQIKTNAYKIIALCYSGVNENSKAIEANDQYKKMYNTPEEIETDYFTLNNVKAETTGNIKISGEAISKTDFKTAAFKVTIYDISTRDNDKNLETVSFVINDVKQGEKKTFEVTTNSQLEMKNLKYRISFDKDNSKELEQPKK